MRALRILTLVALGLGSALTMSCDISEYCLNCAVGDAPKVDAAVEDAPIDGDAIDGDVCVPTGAEVCDNKDNDCNGLIDDAVPTVGDLCTNQVGECAGGVVTCSAGVLGCSKPPMAELCDNKDNNCNGLFDEGDPGGGAKCGTDVGECVAGTNRCVNGAVMCIGAIGAVGGQPETCNGKDDDCDSLFDEGLTNLGACDTGTDVGECAVGMKTCTGGGTVCVGAVGPSFEVCDGLDQDCDGNPTNGYDLMTDPQNCGMCGLDCNLPNAVPTCAGGSCTVTQCQAGFHDNNHMVADGCEYGPCNISGAEVCDGVDNDCDGNVDEALTPPPICKAGGACGATAPVAMCQGAMGWRCNYPATVSTDANGNIVAETRCDTIDNDCDGNVDEGQPNKGAACGDSGIGICQSKGTFQCNPANLNGPATCTITMPGATPTAEVCDGKDNNCDGMVDNPPAAGALIDTMVHVTVGGQDFFIDKYEASHPDATATATGTGTTRACSNPSVVPWRNVTFATAAAACTAAGKTLCTGVQWGAACEGTANTTYPYGNAFVGNRCNTESFDGVPGGTDDDVLIPTGNLAQCLSVPGALDLSGNLAEWTNDITGTTGNGTNIAVLRGGSYLTPAAGATCDFRTSRAAVNVIAAENGFRCCK